MAKPWIHAESSARKFGGKPDDYLPIHNFMDSSKSAMGDNRHRALTHNAWFVGFVLEKVFGTVFTNSDGKMISTRDIGEQHVFEDLGCLPTAQDYIAEMPLLPWMEKKGTPPSIAKLAKGKTSTNTIRLWDND